MRNCCVPVIVISWLLQFVSSTVYKDIRLSGGQSENEGRVEVLMYDVWSTVCDDGWDLQDAIVACKELGYPGAETYFVQGHFGPGNGYMLLAYADCRGTEESLRDCRMSELDEDDCQHGETAGVRCTLRVTAPNVRPCYVTSAVQGRHQEIVNVTWQVPDLENMNGIDIEYFTVYATTTTEKQSFKVDDPKARWFAIDTLEPGRYFTFEVTLSTSGGESPASVATDQSILFMPVLPRLTEAPFFLSITSESVTIGWVEWNPTRDFGTPTVIEYIPYHKLSESSEWINGSKVLFHKDYEYTFKGLIPGKFYDFSVAAVRDGFGGEGHKSPLAKTKVAYKTEKAHPYGTTIVLVFVSAITIIAWKRGKITRLISFQTNQETSTEDLLQTKDQETSTSDFAEETTKGEETESATSDI